MTNWNHTQTPLRARLQMPATDVINRLRQAFAVHQQGRLDEAERLYRSVLSQLPEQADALHFLGVVEVQRGNYEAALALMDRALAANPRNPAALYNRANALRDLGRLQEALAGYDASIALKPDNAAALNNRGVVLHDLGRYEEALASFDRALTLKSGHADAHVNRGNTLMEMDRHGEALASYDRALAIGPDMVSALYGRGNALVKLDRLEEAVASYDRALRLMPGEPRVLNNRGTTLTRLNRYEEAIADFDRAIAASADGPEPLTNRGDALLQLHRYEEALASYNRALELNAAACNAIYGRGSALVELKRHSEAIAAFDRLLMQKPDYPYGRAMLVYAQRTCCDWRQPFQEQALIEGIRAGDRATPLVLLAISDSPADKLRCAQTLVQHKYPAQTPLWHGDLYRHERIRIAYVSPDFRAHPVATLMAGVFEHHDRNGFETIAISHGHDDGSEMRRRLEGTFDRFIDVQGRSDRDIAGLMRELEIDIAVDLTGPTASAKSGIFTFRPAPVQVNYLGFAGTTGIPAMDYILADATTIPAEHQPFYTEKPIYLPGSYMPHDDTRRVAPAPSRTAAGLPEGGFVFASFNNSYKFTPETFDIWMRLLRAADGSVLWLAMANLTAIKNLRAEAEKRGIAPERIVFAPYVTRPEEHLARLSLADLFLDTLPYNAHSTAMDALWAGVPVLTCKGGSFASRVAASLLGAAGMPELITESLPEYENLALELVRDSDRLHHVKEKLRRARETSALFDTAGFTRNLETAFRMMWQRTQSGLPPESFAVPSAASTH